MRCVPSLPGRACDSVQAITIAQSRALASDGMQWIARYIARDGRRLEVPDAHGGDCGGCCTLSRAELRDIIACGLGVVSVQWGPRSGEVLDAVTLGPPQWCHAIRAECRAVCPAREPTGVHHIGGA